MTEKAIFFDRDGTLIEDPGYLNDPDQVKILEGVPQALVQLKALGYKLVVVSNQSGIARGILTEKVLDDIHNRLKQLLVRENAYLDAIYYCPYHPDGVVPKYRKESELRKPNPGMLHAAAADMDIDLERSWMVGNSPADVEAGLRAGCRTILIERSFDHNRFDAGTPKPDYKSVNIKEAVNIITKHHRCRPEPPPPPAAVPVSESQPPPQPDQVPQCADPPPQNEQDPSSDIGQTASCDTDYAAADTNSRLLAEILEQLRKNQRQDMFSEFSTTKMLAGVVQVIVFAPLLIAVWFLINSPGGGNRVLICLGFAVVLQLIALTCYIMDRR